VAHAAAGALLLHLALDPRVDAALLPRRPPVCRGERVGRRRTRACNKHQRCGPRNHCSFLTRLVSPDARSRKAAAGNALPQSLGVIGSAGLRRAIAPRARATHCPWRGTCRSSTPGRWRPRLRARTHVRGSIARWFEARRASGASRRRGPPHSRRALSRQRPHAQAAPMIWFCTDAGEFVCLVKNSLSATIARVAAMADYPRSVARQVVQ
jgi:hypothetical protein